MEKVTIRSATTRDRQQLANLIHFEAHVHRHLDWRPPLDWVGYHPYLVAERGQRLLAALACPPDPDTIAWIRLFASSAEFSVGQAWSHLWPVVLEELVVNHDQIEIAAIPLQGWFRVLLEGSKFIRTHEVVVLAWSQEHLPPIRRQPPVVIRAMRQDDLAAVLEIDSAAFERVWHNSLSGLETAYNQAAIATVAEGPDGLVGYQISTATSMGGHLARLAVNPAYQDQGIGYALVYDVLRQFHQRGAQNVTVNTQKENRVSLALYRRAGFKPMGEEYPVYQYFP